MNVQETKIQSFLSPILTLDPTKPLTKTDLLTEEFLIEKEGQLRMYYSPHNEYVNTSAKVFIIGITPGWVQMKEAFTQLLKSINLQHTMKQALKEAKEAASFSGTMRKNLIDMLDQCSVNEVSQTKSTISLFHEKRHLLHTTSIIKYPVFYQNKNYTGHKPSIKSSPLLSSYAFHEFSKELEQIQSPALIIPLGKTVEHIIKELLSEGKHIHHTYLHGFPHPSGANGHRKKQFLERNQKLTSLVKDWLKRN
ncbi:uracil-DNA glycosylase family protein [Metabacillus litoralis]|uniref:uracil-DNA glycosylase family protein n=1 Tax=Metabacillus litoralis TaxID=152268 RepID=UPI0039B0EC87